MADSLAPSPNSLTAQTNDVNARLDSSSSSSIESESKRFKSEHYESEPPLEERLVGVLCCVVCLDLPNQTFYQCTNGHLMCISCLTHLLADARIKDEPSTCPQCRCEISRSACIRNLAVEKAISELPILCGFCNKQMPRSTLDNHEKNICPERLVQCCYTKMGCTWVDKYCLVQGHEANCNISKLSGQEVLPSVEMALMEKSREMAVYKNIYDLLSCEKIVPIDVQLRPYRTDEYIPKLFYESNKFPAHSYQWTVKARVNESQNSNPLHSITRTLSYQLSLKSKLATASVSFSFVVVKGPFGDTPINPAIHEFEFSSENSESNYKELSLCNSTNDCNKLLAAKIINIRIIIVQNAK